MPNVMLPRNKPHYIVELTNGKCHVVTLLVRKLTIRVT